MKHLLSVLFCTCFSIYLTAQQSVEWGNWKTPAFPVTPLNGLLRSQVNTKTGTKEY